LKNLVKVEVGRGRVGLLYTVTYGVADSKHCLLDDFLVLRFKK
jgi:hypothetical protein